MKKSDNALSKAQKGLYKVLDINALHLNNEKLYFRDRGHKSIGFRTGAVEKTIDFFCDIFDLHEYKEQFDKKFRESISGDGNELSKNDALHSSSLCALLCFFNVSEKNPLKYDNVTYTDIYFEVKNKVFDRTTPSNMDVVLTGKDAEGKDSILFVECKFSEFIKGGSSALSEKYLNSEYGDIFKEFKYSECKVFQSGLKQLVAHYIGIMNFVNHAKGYDMSKYYDDERRNLYKKTFTNVAFLEVIFDFEGEQTFTVYRKEADAVFSALKNDNQKRKTINLYGTTTYQKLFEGDNSKILPAKVKEFYKLKSSALKNNSI